MLENIPESFELPACSKPLISIVIPVYNQYAFTHACLYSILKFTPASIPYEVLILDDASCDETMSIAMRIQNVRVYRNATNQGFLKNCNTYIPKARGKYIFLMNNDMEVTMGWLEPLLKAIKQIGVGLVGSCILNPDDTIQAAGNTLLKDGTPLFNYQGLGAEYLSHKKMDVHYISGCCLLFTRSTWNELGGFDDAFLPAYYEDTDFNMRIRYDLEKRVVCVADSKIYHYGNVSYQGKSSELSEAHKKIFMERWGEKIAAAKLDISNYGQYLDDLWRWDTIRFFGFPVMRSYYKNNKKAYYIGKIKVFSRKFIYEGL